MKSPLHFITSTRVSDGVKNTGEEGGSVHKTSILFFLIEQIFGAHTLLQVWYLLWAGPGAEHWGCNSESDKYGSQANGARGADGCTLPGIYTA